MQSLNLVNKIIFIANCKTTVKKYLLNAILFQSIAPHYTQTEIYQLTSGLDHTGKLLVYIQMHSQNGQHTYEVNINKITQGDIFF